MADIEWDKKDELEMRTFSWGSVKNFVFLVISGLFLVRIRYEILSGSGLLFWLLQMNNYDRLSKKDRWK